MSENRATAVHAVKTYPLQASPYRRQLDRGVRWLRFERSLEETYRRESFRQIKVRLRFTLLIALGLAVSVILLDTLVVRTTVPGYITVWRYGVLIPALAITFLATFLPEPWRWYRRIATVLGPVILASATVLIVNIEAQGNQSIFGVLVLAITFVYYLVGLSFYGAIVTNLVGIMTFVISAKVLGLAQTMVIYQFVVLLFASVVGATLAHNLEWLQRESWLEQRLLEETADRDGLTGLYNRRRFEMNLAFTWEQGLRESRPLALMMIDVDYFKLFNDRYGHQAGDEALKQVANVLAGAARRPLDIATRYGGEEFVVLLYDTTHDHAVLVAERILQDVRELGIANATSTASDVITVSIGLAHVMPTAGRSMEGLLQIADQGLYIAKDSGRNRLEVMTQAEYTQMRTGWFDRNGVHKR